ncbi:hypothetical protein KM043_016175 [Ampulex compressa]|nr:hypothetical protein KM043_016175 [Ampulex compressa]
MLELWRKNPGKQATLRFRSGPRNANRSLGVNKQNALSRGCGQVGGPSSRCGDLSLSAREKRTEVVEGVDAGESDLRHAETIFERLFLGRRRIGCPYLPKEVASGAARAAMWDQIRQKRRQKDALANRPLISRSSIFEDRRDSSYANGPKSPPTDRPIFLSRNDKSGIN